MKKRIISLELHQGNFARQVRAMIAATGKNEAEVLKDGVVEFADFAAKYTMPDQGSRNIKSERYKREIKEVEARRVTVTKKGKTRKTPKKLWVVMIPRFRKSLLFKYSYAKSKLKRYQSINYRGLGRAAWFLKVPSALRKPLTLAESKLLSMSPQIWGKSSLSEVRLTHNTATVENKAPEIENYARIALAKGYEAAANKIKKQRLKFLKAQETKFNG